MANTIINGMQWGDEGKGKIVDLLCPAFEVVVRYQGGDNAGHTVRFGDRHFALHLVPSGILHPDTRCVLASGMVINPETLFEEIERLERAQVTVAGRLFISHRAQVLLPLYQALDRAREEALGRGQIGTTARGIGPAYEAKASRSGVRMCELSLAGLGVRIQRLVDRYREELSEAQADSADADALVAQCRAWGDRLRPFLADTEELLNGWMDRGDSVLFEGAQGTLLDIDHGTYPYVTSSSPAAGGACTGAGIAPTRIDGVVGVCKAYTTRVGGGPFLTELTDEVGEFLRKRGNEFGTTTGRPRRCGWLDAVVARHSRRLSGVDCIALTKLDVLDELEEIRVCTGYRIAGEEQRGFPPCIETLERAEPIYRTLPGWRQSTVGVLDAERLPARARDYVALVEEEVGVPVALISTGPRREETIVRDDPKLAELTSGRLQRVLERSRGD